MIRLRFGNAPAPGRWPGGASEIAAPLARMSRVEAALAGRIDDVGPPPRTATVVPPPASAPRWAAASIPRAIPLTTDQAGRREQAAELLRDPQPVRARAARPDDGHGVARARAPRAPPVAAAEEPARRSSAEVAKGGRIAAARRGG